MKKGIKNLAIATMIGVASMGLMTGCEKEEDKPYIQVKGLDTAYIQNGEINLEGAKILYYSNKKDTTADEIRLQESMIANFSTEETGNKVMKVLWNGFELEVQYSVVSVDEVISLYNDARETLLNAEKVHGDMVYTNSLRTYQQSSNVSNNKYYGYARENNQLMYEKWCEKDGDVWYLYESDYESDEDIRDELIGVENDNVMEWAMSAFIGQTGEFTSENLSNFNVDVEYDGEKTTLILKSKGEEDHSLTYTIENGKFVYVEMIERDSEGEIKSLVTSTISYNAEDVEMIDLPTDVEWTDGNL